MREVHRSQFQLGQVPVEKVWINPKSRDDIPAVLKGLQHICDEALRARLCCWTSTSSGVRGWTCGRFLGV